MSLQPKFTVTGELVDGLEVIAELRIRLATAAIQVPWGPQLQKDSRQRGAHASTAIEGKPLTLPEVRVLEGGGELEQRPGLLVWSKVEFVVGDRCEHAARVGHLGIELGQQRGSVHHGSPLAFSCGPSSVSIEPGYRIKTEDESGARSALAKQIVGSLNIGF